MTLDWPWPILQQGLMWLLMFLYWEKMLESHLMETTYSKWSEWQKVYVKIKSPTPGGMSAPYPGLYTCMKSGKNIYKIRLQRYFLKLATNGQSDKAFLLTSEFFHKGLPVPAPGLCTCGKTLKNVYTIRIQRDFFLNSQQMVEVVRAFCWHQNFYPKGLSALARGYIHV